MAALERDEVAELFDRAIEDWKAYLADDTMGEDDPWDVRRSAWALMYDHALDPGRARPHGSRVVER